MYMDTKFELDLNGKLYRLSENHGRDMIQDNKILPPTDYVIKYEHQNHKKQFDNNIQWGDCTDQFRSLIKNIVQ